MHKVHHTTSQHAPHVQYMVNVSLHMNVIYSACMYACIQQSHSSLYIYIYNVYMYGLQVYPVVCMMQGKSVGSPLRHIALYVQVSGVHVFTYGLSNFVFLCCLTPSFAVYATLSLHVHFKSLDTKTQYP